MTLDGLLVALPVIEELDGMFARVTRPLYKRIQEQGFLGRRCLLVARYQRPKQSAPGLKGLCNVLLYQDRPPLQTIQSLSEKEREREASTRSEAGRRALIAQILLTTSDALKVSSVTETDDSLSPKPRLYEKSYPALRENGPSLL